MSPGSCTHSDKLQHDVDTQSQLTNRPSETWRLSQTYQDDRTICCDITQFRRPDISGPQWQNLPRRGDNRRDGWTEAWRVLSVSKTDWSLDCLADVL